MIKIDMNEMFNNLNRVRGIMSKKFFFDKLREEYNEFRKAHDNKEMIDVLFTGLQYLKSCDISDDQIEAMLVERYSTLLSRTLEGYYMSDFQKSKRQQIQQFGGEYFKDKMFPYDVKQLAGYVNSTPSGYMPFGLIAYWNGNYHITIAAKTVDYDEACLFYYLTERLKPKKLKIRLNDRVPFKSRVHAKAVMLTASLLTTKEEMDTLSRVAFRLSHRKWIPHVTFTEGEAEMWSARENCEEREFTLSFSISYKIIDVKGFNINETMVNNVLGK